MTTITLNLPDCAPLSLLHTLAESAGCDLRHSVERGYELRPRQPTRDGETALIRALSVDLCAAWRTGGRRAYCYLESAFRTASLRRDGESMADITFLLDLLFERESRKILEGV